MIFYEQVSEGLSFLHSSVKMVHGNITPENIILNKSGAWKIMGFDFCIQSTNPSEQEVIIFIVIIIQFQIQVFVFRWPEVRTYGTGLDWSAAFDDLRKRAWVQWGHSRLVMVSNRGWSLCQFWSPSCWMTCKPNLVCCTYSVPGCYLWRLIPSYLMFPHYSSALILHYTSQL